MKFGYFDDKAREYVITSPRTPYPWINYLGNQDFFSLISNTAGGYAFYKDALLRRITRYRYNNVPVDSGGRYFYINDGQDIWSPGWKPTKTELDEYSCRHGLGYTKISGAKHGISAELLCFVPQNVEAEVQQLTLKNSSSGTKNFQLFSFVEFCLWNALDDMTNFQRNFNTGEVEVDGSVIYHKTEYRERRNHYAYFSVNSPIDGFDTDRETFMGLYNGFEAPDAVLEGTSRNSVADGWSPIASHSFNISLEAGEEKTLIFLLGYVENAPEEKWEAPKVVNKTKAKATIAQFDTPEKVAAGMNELQGYWDNLLGRIQIESGDERLDRMVNIWNQYQCMMTFNMARSASYFESGIGRGMGFRDTAQDLLGCMHQIPEKARQRILDVAATQFEDGSAYHQYQPLTKKGNFAVGSNFNDDPPWLILGTSAYLKESGDWGILDEQVPFDNDESKAESLFEHLKRSFHHVVNNLGPHKLPLIGRADWNDCLNLNCFSTNPDEPFQTTTNKEGRVAESLMLAGMFVLIGKEYVKICGKLGQTDEAEQAVKHIQEMEQAVIDHGWDDEWYLRAYDDAGEKIGSKECEEGKIFIESQGFCSMAEIGKEQDMPRKALDSAKKYLDTPYGVVLLNPPYSHYYLNLGEVSTYPEGYKENAGIFCHNNPWIMIGESLLGRGDEAFEYYRKICPAYLEEISELHRTEPYVYSQMIAGKDAKRHGEAKNSWLTGTAAWNFVAICQWILGLKPDYDGLQIDPCIPAEWAGFSMTREFRGTRYRIEVKNPDRVCKGIKSLRVDGEIFEGTVLPIFKDGKEHQIEVILGS